MEGSAASGLAPTASVAKKTKPKKSHNLLACNRCNEEFSSGRKLTDHAKSHEDSRLLCGYCKDLAFESFSSLVSHVENEHFVCHVGNCYIYISTANGLKYHSTHVHESLPNFKCAKCDRTFKTLQPKNKHERGCDAVKADDDTTVISEEMSTSVNKEEAVCSFCGEACKDELAKCSHEIWCDKNENKVMVCKLCDKLFKGKEKLKYHLTKGHNQGNFLCNFCHKGFQTLDALKEHYEKCSEHPDKLLTNAESTEKRVSTRSRNAKR